MEKATFGQRFLSYLIDYVCRMFLIGLIIDVFGFKPGTTIGRRQQGIMVVDAEGNEAGFGLMFVRTILKTFFSVISFVLVIFGQDAVHDMILKTKVVQV